VPGNSVVKPARVRLTLVTSRPAAMGLLTPDGEADPAAKRYECPGNPPYVDRASGRPLTDR
jgi:hypothetical protein